MSGGPRVLVTTASRHGSTHEIATELARCLPETTAGRRIGLTTAALTVENRPDPAPFDAVVLGSAVYVGQWLGPARSFAFAHTDVLRRRPVWLLSSGPIGEPPFPPDEPHDAGPIGSILGVRGHRVLPGRVDTSLLTFSERAMVAAMRAPVGDFRDWEALRSWAEEIADDLARVPQRSH